MTDEEFADLLSLGHERRGIEFKGCRPRTDRVFFAKVARAAIGMANRRNGGYVIIGVEDSSGTLTPTGLCAEDLRTWKYDDVAVSISGYADPSIGFELETMTYLSNKYIVITVYEFEEIPILCKNNCGDVLRKGACYVRSRHKPETSEIPSQEEMRELLELATEKRLRKFLAQAKAAGLTNLAILQQPTDADLFARQLGELA